MYLEFWLLLHLQWDIFAKMTRNRANSTPEVVNATGFHACSKDSWKPGHVVSEEIRLMSYSLWTESMLPYTPLVSWAESIRPRGSSCLRISYINSLTYNNNRFTYLIYLFYIFPYFKHNFAFKKSHNLNILIMFFNIVESTSIMLIKSYHLEHSRSASEETTAHTDRWCTCSHLLENSQDHSRTPPQSHGYSGYMAVDDIDNPHVPPLEVRDML